MRASRLILRATLAPGLCVGLLAEEAPGHDSRATPSPLQLEWVSAEPACDGNVVASRSLQLVGPGVSPQRVEARAVLSRDGHAWVVELETRSANHTGKRTLRGESCGEIQEALALLLAMILESESDLTPAPPGSSPSETPSGVPLEPPSPSRPLATDNGPVPTEAPAATALARVGWLLRLDGDAAVGLKPGLAFGVGAAAGLRFGAWELSVVGSYWPPTRADITDSEGEIEVVRMNVGVRGCVSAWEAGALSISPCLSPQLTVFHSTSLGIAEATNGYVGPLPSATAGVDFRYRLLGPYLFAVLSPGVTWEKSQPFELIRRAMCDEPPCAIVDRPEVYSTMDPLGVAPRLQIGVHARF